jgi:DNA polymerase-2
VSGETKVRGFILSRQWQETAVGQNLIFWLSSERGPIRVSLGSQESVFFIRRKDLEAVQRVLGTGASWRHAEIELKVFEQGDADLAVACYFPNQKGLNFARSRLRQTGLPLYEADIRPTDRYLMERFIQGSVSLMGELTRCDDYWECQNPKLQSVDYIPDLKIVSLDIETSYNENILYSIAIYANNVRKVFMVCDDKSAPLEYLEYLPDERSLISRFLQWFAENDPDIIIGWSVVAFDLWFLQQRCDALDIKFALGRNAEPVKWRTVSRGRERNYALVPGRVVLDGIELLRTATYNFESFALDFVARELLGRGKLVDDVDARASEIQEMYKDNKKKLAEYNLEDCALVFEIFERTELIDFAIQRSRLTGLDMDRAGGSVAAFDFLYLPRLHRQGYVAPVVDEGDGSPSPGGFVLDSQPGLYDDVIVLDFKSLYPSIIRTFHIDPLALISAGEDAIPGFVGGTFSRSSAILPTIIAELWQARDQAKRAGQAANSQAIKIIMNSFYGVLGTTGCRFLDSRLVSSITMRGHEILKKTRDLIETQGYPVIYGDTDSVFVHVKNAGKTADEIGRELTVFLNDWWTNHLEEEYSLVCYLEVEYETHFNRFLMPTVRGSDVGSKKRYAGMIRRNGVDEYIFKGLEAVRSDWSPLARDFQQKLYRLVFEDLPFADYVRGVVEEVNAGKRDDMLVLRRRIRRGLHEYLKNVPPHVRAARRLAEIRKERGLPDDQGFGSNWVEYIMTTGGPEPRLYRESPIDYQFYIDKQLAPIADAILLFRSSSLAKIIDKQLGLF